MGISTDNDGCGLLEHGEEEKARRKCCEQYKRDTHDGSGDKKMPNRLHFTDTLESITLILSSLLSSDLYRGINRPDSVPCPQASLPAVVSKTSLDILRRKHSHSPFLYFLL